MTFGFVKAETVSFPITRMCQVLDVSRSGFFPWQYRPACRRQQQDMIWTPALAGAVAALALPDAADPPLLARWRGVPDCRMAG